FTQRCVRDRRYKYVYSPTAFDELYDLEADPGELTNRIDDPALESERVRLRARLAAWMESVGDPLLNPWTRVHLLNEKPFAAALPNHPLDVAPENHLVS